MKLYGNEPIKRRELSIEEHVRYLSVASVVSTEAITDYLYNIKDTLSTIYNKTLNGDIDKMALDALTSRYEYEHVAASMKMSQLNAYTVNKPEGFRGYYIDYVEDLHTCSLLISDNAFNGLDQLKISVGKLINDSSSEEVDILFGRHLYKEIAKDTEYVRTTLSKYHKGGKDTRVEIKRVLKNLKDVPKLNEKTAEVGSIITTQKAIELQRRISEVTEYIDALVEQETNNSIIARNVSVKKDLTEAIYTVSQAAETYGYIYGLLLSYYKGHKNLAEEVIRISNLDA